jgi:hypothetical protein
VGMLPERAQEANESRSCRAGDKEHPRESEKSGCAVMMCCGAVLPIFVHFPISLGIVPVIFVLSVESSSIEA